MAGKKKGKKTKKGSAKKGQPNKQKDKKVSK